MTITRGTVLLHIVKYRLGVEKADAVLEKYGFEELTEEELELYCNISKPKKVSENAKHKRVNVSLPIELHSYVQSEVGVGNFSKFLVELIEERINKEKS